MFILLKVSDSFQNDPHRNIFCITNIIGNLFSNIIYFNGQEEDDIYGTAPWMGTLRYVPSSQSESKCSVALYRLDTSGHRLKREPDEI